MIRQIIEEDFSKIDPFFEQYFKSHRNDNPNAFTQLKKNLLAGFEAKKILLLGLYSHNQEKIQAISGLDLENGFIMLWDLEKTFPSDKESLKELIQVGLDHLKNQNFKIIRMTSRSTNGLNESMLLNLGFRKFERTKMSLTSEIFMEQTILEINQNVTFQPWSDGIKEKLLPILVDSHFNYDHPDGYVFCHYIGIEGCRRYIKDMEDNMFGIFLAEHSYGCFLDDRLIGGIIFLNREGNGYISEIVVDSSLKGQHLGKSILCKAITNWFERNPDSQQVDLDVTLKNQNAYHLYKSLGFQEREHYVFYCWVDPTIQTIV